MDERTDDQIVAGEVLDRLNQILRHDSDSALSIDRDLLERIADCLMVASRSAPPHYRPMCQKAGDNRVETCAQCGETRGNVILRDVKWWKVLPHKTPLYAYQGAIAKGSVVVDDARIEAYIRSLPDEGRLQSLQPGVASYWLTAEELRGLIVTLGSSHG